MDGEAEISSRNTSEKSKGNRNHPVLKGRLNFKKFETSKINDCIDFIKTMKLHLGGVYKIGFFIIETLDIALYSSAISVN